MAAPKGACTPLCNPPKPEMVCPKANVTCIDDATVTPPQRPPAVVGSHWSCPLVPSDGTPHSATSNSQFRIYKSAAAHAS